MDKIVEVEGLNGLYKVEKVKMLYLLGYGEKIAYITNLDTRKTRIKEIKQMEKIVDGVELLRMIRDGEIKERTKNILFR